MFPVLVDRLCLKLLLIFEVERDEEERKRREQEEGEKRTKREIREEEHDNNGDDDDDNDNGNDNNRYIITTVYKLVYLEEENIQMKMYAVQFTLVLIYLLLWYCYCSHSVKVLHTAEASSDHE